MQSGHVIEFERRIAWKRKHPPSLNNNMQVFWQVGINHVMFPIVIKKVPLLPIELYNKATLRVPGFAGLGIIS